MRFFQYQFAIDKPLLDIVLAFLNELPFQSFEETPSGWNAYLSEDQDPEELEAALERLQTLFPFSVSRQLLETQNWNAIWESNFQPIRVGDFCGIRADFHPVVTGAAHQIVINPKMAFGTGHHETTFMMIQLMEDLAMTEKKVLDFGCGTGILAILAAKMGATMVDAVDIEREAYENTIENVQVNNIDAVRAIHGNLNAVLDTGFDVVLANINRNVILDSLHALYLKLKNNGILLISGILITDRLLVLASAHQAGFILEEQLEKGDWLALKLKKRTGNRKTDDK